MEKVKRFFLQEKKSGRKKQFGKMEYFGQLSAIHVQTADSIDSFVKTAYI